MLHFNNINLIINSPKTAIAGYIFNYPIRYYGLILTISFIIGILFAMFLFNKKNAKNDNNIFIDYIPLVIFFAILGARLFYVLGNWGFYYKNPAEIFMINHGGLSIFGAIIVGLVSIFFLSLKNKFNFLFHLDVFAICLPLCQAIGRFGNYFNQEAFGRPTSGTLKLFVDTPYRPSEFQDFAYFHPTFLYESILDFALFLALFSFFIKSKTLKNGTFALLYLIFYSIIRFLVEGYRIDSVLNIGMWHIAHIFSVLIFSVSLTCLIFMYIKKRPQ